MMANTVNPLYNWANSAHSDQTAGQGLHCSQFCFLDTLPYGKCSLFSFRVITANFSDIRLFRSFTVHHLFLQSRIQRILEVCAGGRDVFVYPVVQDDGAGHILPHDRGGFRRS